MRGGFYPHPPAPCPQNEVAGVRGGFYPHPPAPCPQNEVAGVRGGFYPHPPAPCPQNEGRGVRGGFYPHPRPLAPRTREGAIAADSTPIPRPLPPERGKGSSRRILPPSPGPLPPERGKGGSRRILPPSPAPCPQNEGRGVRGGFIGFALSESKDHLTAGGASNDNARDTGFKSKAMTKTVCMGARSRLPDQGAGAIDWKRRPRQLQNSLPSRRLKGALRRQSRLLRWSGVIGRHECGVDGRR